MEGMQVKRTSFRKINGLNDVDALALRRQPSLPRENLQDQKFTGGKIKRRGRTIFQHPRSFMSDIVIKAEGLGKKYLISDSRSLIFVT